MPKFKIDSRTRELRLSATPLMIDSALLSSSSEHRRKIGRAYDQEKTRLCI